MLVTTKTPLTVAHGDGIGPEIMAATLKILEAGGAAFAIETIEIGEAIYKSGFTSGIKPEAWESLRRTKLFLKAPITTPQGGGYKSLNVTVRKTLGLFANVRPCMAYPPMVKTLHPKMDLVIVRENEEDLYAGIEHRQSEDVYQCLKLITRPGSEKIIRYAFEYARLYGRKKVTCFVKDNIMKLTDGIFHQVFREVGAEYPDIEKESLIVDIGAARLADTPEMFDVLVMANLYGDILSDVASQIAGSVGLGGSANIGEHIAMFEAVHGSAPAIAGKDIANPSGLLLSAIMLLLHVGQKEAAETIHNAWFVTLEDGVHTGDIFVEGASKKRVGCKEFSQAVIERLGKKPHTFKPVSYVSSDTKSSVRMDMAKICRTTAKAPAKKELVGIDVFVSGRFTPNDLGKRIEGIDTGTLALKMISNRGVATYPSGAPETFCVDHWRCRFLRKDEKKPLSYSDCHALVGALSKAGMEVIKTENLYFFDGAPGYSLGQGE